MKSLPKPRYRFVSSIFLPIFTLILSFHSLTSTVLAQDAKEVVAVVNGRSITQSEIESFIPSHYLILEPQQLYNLRKVALENVIVRSLLVEEAKHRRISVEALRKEMTFGRINLPDNRVDQEYLKNALYFASMSPDEAKERIRLDLESEARMQLYLAAVSKLKAKAKIENFLTEPPLTLENANEIEPPSKGPKNAKVTILEFADYQCSYCRESQEIIKRILTDFKEDVRLVYKHFPLQTNTPAIVPAIAAHCAKSQGHFWAFHDLLFASSDLSLNSIKDIAGKTGLDLPKFDSCLTSENSRFAVLANLKEAMQLGITSTPTFIINGKVHSGKLDLAEFSDIIQRELKIFQKNTKKQ